MVDGDDENTCGVGGKVGGEQALKVLVSNTDFIVSITNFIVIPIPTIIIILIIPKTHLQASKEEDGEVAGEADARANRGTRRIIFLLRYLKYWQILNQG